MSPLLKHWRYYSFALAKKYWYIPLLDLISWLMWLTHIRICIYFTTANQFFPSISVMRAFYVIFTPDAALKLLNLTVDIATCLIYKSSLGDIVVVSSRQIVLIIMNINVIPHDVTIYWWQWLAVSGETIRSRTVALSSAISTAIIYWCHYDAYLWFMMSCWFDGVIVGILNIHSI